MDIQSIIKDLTGKEVLSLPDYTDIWLEWFKGDVAEFHHYENYNGVKKVNSTRRTLNMAKKVAEDWANLLLNEKTDIAYGDEKQQQKLWDLLNSVNFWVKGNQGVELSFGLGNGAFVESFDKDNKPRLQFVNAKKSYPLTIDQDKITECAFVNSNTNSTIIQIHIKGRIEEEKFVYDDKGNYHIRTVVYQKKNKTDDIGQLVSDEIFDTGSQMAWFQMVKPNIANNIDINSPLGISIFANALDSLQGVDLAYDGFCEEMRLGKIRIFLDKKLTHYDEDGEHILFDVNETGFYWTGNGEANDKKPFEAYTPQLRTESYFTGINNALNLLSGKCGFGENHYRFDQNGISTATQVISQNSELFRTLKKHEILLNEVIIGVCKTLMYIHNNFTSDSFKFDLDENLEVKFDDSIIEDVETERARDRADVNLGVMSEVEYRMKWFNEDEETARKKIEEIRAEKQAGYNNFFSEE
ncbi:MAG: phage portal protein [Methanobrevibacter sp.]|nr:phage portal protein [Methanobrevibacter sp.]MBO7712139.1 phage portal protein [Methanobrevibacter sp.]